MVESQKVWWHLGMHGGRERWGWWAQNNRRVGSPSSDPDPYPFAVTSGRRLTRRVGESLGRSITINVFDGVLRSGTNRATGLFLLTCSSRRLNGGQRRKRGKDARNGRSIAPESEHN